MLLLKARAQANTLLHICTGASRLPESRKNTRMGKDDSNVFICLSVSTDLEWDSVVLLMGLGVPLLLRYP